MFQRAGGPIAPWPVLWNAVEHENRGCFRAEDMQFWLENHHARNRFTGGGLTKARKYY